MLERVRQRVLVEWSALLSSRPRWIIAVALVLTVAALVITLTRWQFVSSRNALLSEELEWNQRFINWVDTFEGTEDLVVVIDAGVADDPANAAARQAKARELADELGAQLLADDRYFEAVVWRFHVSRSSPRAMRLLQMDEFRARLNELSAAGPVLASETPAELLGYVSSQFGIGGGLGAASGEGAQPPAKGEDAAEVSEDGGVEQQVEGVAWLTALVRAMRRTMEEHESPRNYFQELGTDGEAQPWEYLVSDNGRLLFMRVTPRQEQGTLSAMGDAIAAMRTHIDAVAQRYPGIDAGLTGIEAIEHDETAAVTRDSTIASIVALVLIATLLIIAFHSFRTPLLALSALLVGIAWSFGFLFLAVGHLQVLSIFFTVILLGLGIAYGIHLVSRFELVRHEFPDDKQGFAATLRNCFEVVGPGIVTGAITTSAAFVTTVFTDFAGVAEMGLIAAVGIVLCLLAMFSVFPALLRIFKPLHRHIVPMDERKFHFFEERWVLPFARWPVPTLVVSAVLTVVSLFFISPWSPTGGMRFDYNLERLLPRDVPSVQWQRRVVEAGQSVHSGVSIVDDMAEAQAQTAAFRKLSTVEDVMGIGLLFPPDDAQKRELIREARRGLGETVDQLLASPADARAPIDPESPDLMTRLRQLQTQLGLGRMLGGLVMPEELKAELAKLNAAIGDTRALLDSMTPAQRADRLRALRTDYRDWRRWLAQAFDLGPMTPNDLPAELLRPYRSSDGKLALEIHPRVPRDIQSPLDPRFLPRFIDDLEQVDLQVTGVIVQYYKSGALIWSSYVQAGLYALLIVFVLVWIDFRRLNDALLALVPVACGFAVTFGIMHLSGMRINPANIIALPLMFGIGVDSGVHVIHRYRQDDQTRPLGLTAGTGKGITLTSLTCMIGFGAMMLASHRGIFSLGFVMTLGIGLTLLSCWMIMPAWLELRTRRRVRRRAIDD